MSAPEITEADVRLIVRHEIEASRLRGRRKFAEQMLESSRVAESENPAEPGSLLARVQGIRRHTAEQVLASVLLAEAASNSVDGVPESFDVGFDIGGIQGVVQQSRSGIHANTAADVFDGFDNVVGHESSPSGAGSAPRNADASTSTVGDTPGSTGSPSGESGATPGGAV